MVSKNRHPQSLEGRSGSQGPLLGELAELHGVQMRYRDTRGRWRESPLESVAQVLWALGAEIDPEDVAVERSGAGRLRAEARLAAAIDARKTVLWGGMVEPVLVAWDGEMPAFTLRLPGAGRHSLRSDLRLTLTLETGERFSRNLDRGALEVVERAVFGGRRLEACRVRRTTAESLELRRLPFGYHRLWIESGKDAAEAHVISAPRRCWAPGGRIGGAGRDTVAQGTAAPGSEDAPCPWGLFVPLYALRSERDWGAGDLADLRDLCEQVDEVGGTVVATLPRLASYLDRPFEPSPYRPVSRLCWNEFYLAVEQIPEYGPCRAAREIRDSAGIQERLAGLRAEPFVDYREVAALKRRVVEELSRCFFERAEGRRRNKFEGFLQDHPDVGDYAAFRARVDAVGADWRSRPRGASTDTRPEGWREAERYHLYCQWQMEEQLSHLVARGDDASDDDAPGDRAPGGYDAPGGETTGLRRRPTGLLLDLPVGVHPGGFDTWRWPQLFAPEVSMGAPPDSFFAGGQDWESPPLHPDRAREQGHQYFAQCVRHHMRHAQFLRVDHVMGLHRLFWVPEGKEPADGVYVGYPAEELYAVLSLESHRHRTVVVGEDLGTVPPGVRSGMRRHGVLGTWVLQSSLRPRAAEPIARAPRHAVASLGTHDMSPFAGFLEGADIRARVETGQLDEEGARRAGAARGRLVTRLAAALESEASHTSGTAPTPVLVPAPDPGSHEAAMLEGALAYLLRSEAALVLVNLEDLLLETRPQNLPGTGAEWKNWRRKIGGSEAVARQAVVRFAREITDRFVMPSP